MYITGFLVAGAPGVLPGPGVLSAIFMVGVDGVKIKSSHKIIITINFHKKILINHSKFSFLHDTLSEELL